MQWNPDVRLDVAAPGSWAATICEDPDAHISSLSGAVVHVTTSLVEVRGL